MDGIIAHIDMNNFFASVECLYNENLRCVPMAVVGDPAMRHGIILAKNEIAKKLGVTTGESIYSAKQKVPRLVTVLADYSKYVLYSKKAREIYSEYSDEVTAYGLDENWVNLTGRVKDFNRGIRLAHDIRERVKAELGLTVSVGLSYNYIFSKLGSDLAKRDSLVVLTKNDLESVIWNRPAFELLFVGPATRKKLTAMGILTIGDLARYDVRELRRILGKNGETLFMFANGDDRGFDPKAHQNDPFQSLGNSITLPYDLHKELDILTMFYVLSKTVASRLKKHKLKACCVSIYVKYNDFSVINRQMTVEFPTDKDYNIYKIAKRLFLSNFNKSPVRGMGIHVSKLFNNQYEQLTLFDEETDILNEIGELERNLNERLKGLKVERLFNFGFAAH